MLVRCFRTIHVLGQLREICKWVKGKRGYLMTLMNQSYVLPQITVPLPAYWTWGSKLVMHIHNVPLQISFQVAAVTTVTTLVILDLNMKM